MSEAKKYATVHGRRMAYVDRGDGPVLLFLHGNPTSSFLWRNVIEPLCARARCIAPDLIGMGDSDKLPDSGKRSYSFAEHRSHLDALLEQLPIAEPLVLVVHDWGSALGFDWARRHPQRVRAIVYMEAIVGVSRWSEWPLPAALLFRTLRSPLGEYLVLRHNFFVKRLLPANVMRRLEPDELREYARPFDQLGEGRRPTLTWPREVPVSGHPAQVCQQVEAYADWMARNDIPKLFINAEPGRILVGRLREQCRRWPNQREVTVRGTHFIQEDSPGEIAHAIESFLRELDATASSPTHAADGLEMTHG